MKKSGIILAASFFSTALLVGALQTGSANAAPPVQPQAQIAKIVKADAVQEIGWRKRRVRRFVRRHLHPWRWCRNHPVRCHGRAWRFRPGYGVGYAGGGALCHRHLFSVLGMGLHARVRCDHRHYRAYRSWEFAR